MKQVFLTLLTLVLIASLSFAADEPTIAPNENLAVDGIPPIPASIAASVARYNNVRFATLADWHPTKREILISTRFADSPQIHLVKAPGGDRAQLTFYPEPVRGAKYSTTGDFFVFQKTLVVESSTSTTATTLRPGTPRCSPTASRATPEGSGRIPATRSHMVQRGAPATTSIFT
jgi:hypothetical protein